MHLFCKVLTKDVRIGVYNGDADDRAASLWSTRSDLARLIVEVLKSYKEESNLVLSAEVTRQMLTPRVSWVGLGFPMIEEDGRTKFEHPRWKEGFHSLLVGCLDTAQGLVWMANGTKDKHLGSRSASLARSVSPQSLIVARMMCCPVSTRPGTVHTFFSVSIT